MLAHAAAALPLRLAQCGCCGQREHARPAHAPADRPQAHHDLGVTVAVLADSGGGAPLLVATRFEAAFAGGSGSGVSGGKQAEQQQQDTQQNGSSAAMATAAPAAGAGPPDAAAAAAEAQPELVPVDSCTLAVEAPSPAAALAASTGHLSLKGGGTAGSRGLILLVPLTLGIGKVSFENRVRALRGAEPWLACIPMR